MSSKSDGMEDTFVITLDLIRSKVKLPIKRSDEQYFREAAIMMQETYDKYLGFFPPSEGPSRSIDYYLKLVALEYGVKLKKLIAANEELKKRLIQLDSELSESLEK